ncbi:MAG: class IV adenylate cyclase [Rhodothermales bacterium]
MPLNIEIKARCDDQDRIRRLLKERQARFVGDDHQIDTYFRVPEGRMKLREGRIENALIYYERTDQQGPKVSDVTLHRTESGASLKTILSKALGVWGEVDKRREIYFIDNVKFHLDRVAGLGTFVEIEAIDRDGSIGQARLQAQCEHYLALLGVPAEALVPVSYSDMLLRQEGNDSIRQEREQ